MYSWRPARRMSSESAATLVVRRQASRIMSAAVDCRLALMHVLRERNSGSVVITCTMNVEGSRVMREVAVRVSQRALICVPGHERRTRSRSATDRRRLARRELLVEVGAEREALEVVEGPRERPAEQALHRHQVPLLARLLLHGHRDEADREPMARAEGHVGHLLQGAEHLAAGEIVVRKRHLQAERLRERRARCERRALQQVPQLIERAQQRHPLDDVGALRQEERHFDARLEARDQTRRTTPHVIRNGSLALRPLEWCSHYDARQIDRVAG